MSLKLLSSQTILISMSNFYLKTSSKVRMKGVNNQSITKYCKKSSNKTRTQIRNKRKAHLKRSNKMNKY